MAEATYYPLGGKLFLPREIEAIAGVEVQDEHSDYLRF